MWFFNLLLFPLIYLLLKKLDWHALVNDKGLQHRFFAVCLLLLLIWQVNISLNLDVTIHFLGITTLCLMFGWQLALLAGFIAQFGFLFTGAGQLESFGLNYFINAAFPILFTWRVHVWIESLKPQNPFVFIMGAGFMSCLVSSVLVAMFAGIMLYMGGEFLFALDLLDYISFLPLFIFPEAVVNGMFISGFSILHPHWMYAFNDERYFRRPEVGHEVTFKNTPKALDLDAQEMQNDRHQEDEKKKNERKQEDLDLDKYRPPAGWQNEALNKDEKEQDLIEKDNKKHD